MRFRWIGAAMLVVGASALPAGAELLTKSNDGVARLEVIDKETVPFADGSGARFTLLSSPASSKKVATWRKQAGGGVKGAASVRLVREVSCEDDELRTVRMETLDARGKVLARSGATPWGLIPPKSGVEIRNYVCDFIDPGDPLPSSAPATSAPAAPTAAPTTAAATALPSTQAPTTSPAPPAFQTVRREGGGDTITPAFELTAGLTVFRAVGLGSSNFAVVLLDRNGKYVKLLVNEIGRWEGVVAAAVPAGAYSLEVESAGPWSIDIDQPRAASGAPIPQTITGTGKKVLGPFQASGVVRVQLNHDGKSNFAIESYSNAAYTGLIVNVIGNYAGTTSFTPRGPFWLDVDADGNWAIQMNPF